MGVFEYLEILLDIEVHLMVNIAVKLDLIAPLFIRNSPVVK